MTEKDAVKCGGSADERHWYVPVNAYFDAGESHTLLSIVMSCIADPRGAPQGTVHG